MPRFPDKQPAGGPSEHPVPGGRQGRLARGRKDAGEVKEGRAQIPGVRRAPMPALPKRQRFGAFGPSQQPGRYRAAGLGGSSEVRPEEDYGALEETLPLDGFTGYRSRSRFASFSPAPVLAHGGAPMLTSPGIGPGRDPATGRTVFGRLIGLYDQTWWLLERRRTSALDPDSERLTKSGRGVIPGQPALVYHRRNIDADNAGTKPADLIRWDDGGPRPRAWRDPRYTLRREFMQGAQSFMGQHTQLRKLGAMSASPVTMAAPRTSRLSRRAPTGSFGQRTQVLNDAG